MNTKVLIYSDVHWSTYTSIVRARGERFSKRLELLIKSMNWVNELATRTNCQSLICAGDMFDKSTCNDEELTALKEIHWVDIPSYFLIGNHESSVSSLDFSSVAAITQGKVSTLINTPASIELNTSAIIHFIPYVTEDAREPISKYIQNTDENKRHIVISHNDIKGIQYGGFISKTGFSIEEIENSCDLYLNGHLHNSEWVTSKILNVGSLSAHNFTNDSSKYSYGAWVLDLDTLKIEFYENPYSLNFYKLDWEQDLGIEKFKDNAILQIKYLQSHKSAVDNYLKEHEQSLMEVKRLVTFEQSANKTQSNNFVSVDHLNQFKTFIIDRLGGTDIVLEELQNILS